MWSYNKASIYDVVCSMRILLSDTCFSLITALPPGPTDTLKEEMGGKSMGQGRSVWAASAPTATPPPTLPDSFAHLGFSRGSIAWSSFFGGPPIHSQVSNVYTTTAEKVSSSSSGLLDLMQCPWPCFCVPELPEVMLLGHAHHSSSSLFAA